jgi:hypothetical protein
MSCVIERQLEELANERQAIHHKLAAISVPDTYETQARFLVCARQLLKPTPVDRGKLPRRFEKIADKLRGLGLLDHYGMTVWEGCRAFVTEPYGQGVPETDLEAIALIAAQCGCGYYLTANSWHYPGRTLRILFC